MHKPGMAIRHVMGALPQALGIIFEVQKKRSNEKKITRKKLRFSTYKMCFFFLFFPPSLSTSSIFKSHNFLIFYSFKAI